MRDAAKGMIEGQLKSAIKLKRKAQGGVQPSQIPIWGGERGWEYWRFVVVYL